MEKVQLVLPQQQETHKSKNEWNEIGVRVMVSEWVHSSTCMTENQRNRDKDKKKTKYIAHKRQTSKAGWFRNENAHIH